MLENSELSRYSLTLTVDRCCFHGFSHWVLFASHWRSSQKAMTLGSMGRTQKIFTDPFMVEFYGINVGKYTIHGWYG